MKRALILDGETRTALAVARSLSACGFENIIASTEFPSITPVSRAASGWLRSPSPTKRPADYRIWLHAVVQALSPDYLLPVTTTSVAVAASIRESFPKLTIFPFDHLKKLSTINLKGVLLETAAQLGVPIPRTLFLPPGAESNRSLLDQIESFPYPACLKPNESDSEFDAGVIKLRPRYPENAEQTLSIIRGEEDPRWSAVPLLLQERIIGDGIGVSVLCDMGKPLLTFCHQRLLEKPPSGGVSVLSQALDLTDAPVAESYKLLKHFEFSGVAMVEFKRTVDGTFSLIEINPRFWGSLQLAIDCGYNFPAELYNLFAAKIGASPVALPERAIRTQRRLRWLLGTLDHFLTLFRNSPQGALSDLIFHNSLRLSFEPTGLDVLRLSDPKPALIELRNWFAALKRRNAQNES